MRDPEQRAIHRYVFELGPGLATSGPFGISCFRAAVRDARRYTGRDVDSGNLIAKGTISWPGVTTYLVLLDQIGKAIAPARRARSDVPFLTALEEFAPTVDVRDRDMLYALRCALAHEFGLANENQTRVERQHLFELHDTPDYDTPALAIYGDQWNGRYGTDRRGGPTKVNLARLTELIEDAVARIEEAAEANAIVLVDGITPEVLLQRWGVSVYGGEFN